MHYFKLAIYAILFFFTLESSGFAVGLKVTSFEYVGNNRISNETIFAYLEINIGDNMDNTKINNSVKSLYNTGFFSDVKISQLNNKLIIEVSENPTISKIAFEGNKKLEDSDLLAELSLKPHTVFSPYKLQSDLNRITSLYQRRGRYSAQIEPKIIKLDQNRINLIYEIDEGNETVIKKINFSGNTHVSDSELSEVIFSKEYRFYRFFSSVDIFDPEKLDFDKELLRKFYLNKGFADFKVTAATSELSLKKDAFLLTYIIHEGGLYSYGNIVFENNIKDLDHEKMKPLITLKEGNKFNQEEIDTVVESLTNYLGNNGYPFVDIEPEIITNPETLRVDIKFVIKESFRVYVNKINIKNNTRTLDRVIRREFKISEGDPYNIAKIQRSKQRLENLGFFSKVDFKNQKTNEPDKMNLEVEVGETSTGGINLAGGYDTTTGILGQIGIYENNFLGKGQQVDLITSLAQKERNVNFSFTEPYFMDKNISAGFNIFNNSRDYKSTSSFNSKTKGAGLTSGYEITEYLSHGVRYSFKKERVSNVSADASIYIKEQQGIHTVSLIGQTFVYDRLNSRIDPSQGYIINFDQDLAGLGGNSKYFSNTLTAAYYQPIFRKDFVFKLVGHTGHIQSLSGKEIKLNDRFWVGPEYIRGFDVAGIGPHVKDGKKDALGGTTYYTATVELGFPLGLPNEIGLRGAVFNDIGSLFGTGIKDKNRKLNIHDKNSLRASAGASLIWKSPLGVIGLHYAIPYRKEKFDDERRFYFNMGTKF